MINNITTSAMLAWLEKKGESKLVGCEDDRIRKWLVDTIKQIPDSSIEWETISKSDVLAWLEKQGEQRSKLVDFDYNAKDSNLQEVTYFIPNGFHAEIDGNKVVIKQGEQKTKWDDELLMVITWFSRIKQMATDMTTYNNHVMNPKECLCEISILAKESIEFIHNNFLNKKKEEQQ